jgi:hypothetical protein
MNQFPLEVILPLLSCSETTLTGESWFHINTPPRGFEPGSLEMGSKRVVHWTSETWWEWSEIGGSSQGSPPAADSVGCEAGRGACSELETRTEELCEIKWDYHIVGTRAYWWFGTKPASDEATEMINHVRVTNVARQRWQENPGFIEIPPRGFEPGSLVTGSKRESTGPVRHGEN